MTGLTTAPRLTFRWILPLLMLLLLGWGLGFVWFVHVAIRRVEPAPVHADGIVALTGGPGRVELALHLLASNQADRLLVSGTGGGTELVTLGRLAGIDTAPLAPRITLGRDASSTRGNAIETASWAAQYRIRSLIVVTSAWHMPRALAELSRALPDIRLYPLPAQSATGQEPGFGPGLRLEAEEFVKYLLATSGLSAWLPHRGASAISHAFTGPDV